MSAWEELYRIEVEDHVYTAEQLNITQGEANKYYKERNQARHDLRLSEDKNGRLKTWLIIAGVVVALETTGIILVVKSII